MEDIKAEKPKSCLKTQAKRVQGCIIKADQGKDGTRVYGAGRGRVLVQKTSNSPKRGWTKRGMSVTVPSSLSRQRRYIFGVLSAATFYFMFYEKANTDSFCDFLENVHEKYGKVLIFLDNASYHKSGGVKETLEKYDGEIILKYLPPSTPELNPVEIQWREIKRRLSARMFKTLDDVERSVRKLFAKRELLPIKLFQYLTG